MGKFADGCYSCAPGIALIAKVLAGQCSMVYTRAAIGSGEIPDGKTPGTMKEPAGYVMDGMISAITNPVDGECQVTVQVSSSKVSEGFFARSILLYAQDPDDGDVPYTYLVLENEPEWIRPSSAIVGKLATFDLIAAVGAVDTVKAAIDPESLVTAKDLARHNADTEAHPSLRPVTVEITVPAEAWQEDESGGDYGFSAVVDCVDAAVSNVPIVTLDKSCLKAAGDAGVCPTVEALDGSLHLWATAKPASELTGWVTLLGPGSGAGGGGISLPVATEDILGGIKASDSLTVDPDGTAHSVPDVATDQEVSDMLRQVFDPQD